MIANMLFNPEITLGNVAQIVTMLSAALAFWFKLREEIGLLKMRIEQLERRHDDLLSDFRRITRIELVQPKKE